MSEPNSSKRIIVTGSSSGIGAQVALKLSLLGHQVIGVDKVAPGSSEVQLRDHFSCDLSDKKTTEKTFERAVDRLGGLDGAVNAAGVFGSPISACRLNKQRLQEVTFQNISICANSMSAEISALKRYEGGRIVNVASVAGSRAILMKSDYVMAKFAIIGLTKTAALEEVSNQISINSVSPGFVQTPMLDTAQIENPHLEGFIKNLTPLGKPVLSASVADLICWLIVSAPSEITGSDYVIDGAYSAK